MSLDRKICGTRLSLTPQHSPVSHSSFLPLPGESKFPSPPALADSLLQLELGLSTFVTDLGCVTNVIRGDIGLTAQLLRFAAVEFGRSPSKITPLSEIVLHLGVDKLKELVTRTRPVAVHSVSSAASDECTRFWIHARLTAFIAEELALQSSEVHAEEAYLSGLFFRLGDLPLLLERSPSLDLSSSDIRASDGQGSDIHARHIGYRMAIAWGFPRPLLDVIAGDPETCHRMSRVLLEIVVAADSWASRLRYLAARESREFGRGRHNAH
jgi:HD-like signal output (HDOD) protein